VTEKQYAAVVADVDATIRYWQDTGVKLKPVALQLKCGANWPSVRAVMIVWALTRD
jgi:hypothetical protein